MLKRTVSPESSLQGAALSCGRSLLAVSRSLPSLASGSHARQESAGGAGPGSGAGRAGPGRGRIGEGRLEAGAAGPACVQQRAPRVPLERSREEPPAPLASARPVRRWCCHVLWAEPGLGLGRGAAAGAPRARGAGRDAGSCCWCPALGSWRRQSPDPWRQRQLQVRTRQPPAAARGAADKRGRGGRARGGSVVRAGGEEGEGQGGSLGLQGREMRVPDQGFERHGGGGHGCWGFGRHQGVTEGVSGQVAVQTEGNMGVPRSGLGVEPQGAGALV